MKYKAFYGSEDEVPDEVKALYVSRNGRWEFQGSEFEGLAELLNPGLAANKETILEEKRRITTRAEDAEKRLSDLQAEVSKLKQPGTVTISSEDNETLTAYKALGPVKDIQKALNTKTELESKVRQIEFVSEVDKVSKTTGMNTDVVSDFLSQISGKNPKLSTKSTKVKDAKGAESEEISAYITVDELDNGKPVQREYAFSDYAKQNAKQYLLDAMFENGKKETSKPTNVEKQSTFRLPKESGRSASETTNSDEKPLISRFNQERDQRKLPWQSSEQPQT